MDQEMSKTKVRGLRNASPPPFLSKTFEMVDDVQTNHIISWSSSGTSFIVWDHLVLASEILPRYFRHSNFSSFIYQLNSYGFRKIGLQKCEYENAWFQAGKKHLLINIKSRNHKSKRINHSMELRDQQEMIASEMEKLRELQGNLQSQMDEFKKHVRMEEEKSREELIAMAKSINRVMIKEVIKCIKNSEENDEISGSKNGKEVRIEELMISKMIMDEVEDVIAKPDSLEE